MHHLHWFIDPLKYKYADFTGRATRQEFWMFMLFSFIAQFIVSATGLDTLAAIFLLALLIPSLSISVRRLHDVNKSGWWLLLAILPLIGWIILIVFMAHKGKTGVSENIATPGENVPMSSQPVVEPDVTSHDAQTKI